MKSGPVVNTSAFARKPVVVAPPGPGYRRAGMRFPTRTLVLMVLTLASFAWFFWRTHDRAPAPRPPVQQVRIVPVDHEQVDAGR